MTISAMGIANNAGGTSRAARHETGNSKYLTTQCCFRSENRWQTESGTFPNRWYKPFGSYVNTLNASFPWLRYRLIAYIKSQKWSTENIKQLLSTEFAILCRPFEENAIHIRSLCPSIGPSVTKNLHVGFYIAILNISSSNVHISLIMTIRTHWCQIINVKVSFAGVFPIRGRHSTNLV